MSKFRLDADAGGGNSIFINIDERNFTFRLGGTFGRMFYIPVAKALNDALDTAPDPKRWSRKASVTTTESGFGIHNYPPDYIEHVAAEVVPLLLEAWERFMEVRNVKTSH